MTIVRELVDTNDKHVGYVFWCPGCEEAHQYDHRWKFNGNLESPTFTPSLLVRWTHHENGKDVEKRCHSFVTDGQIRFLNDCTHALKGQTVPIPPLPWGD